MSPLLDSEQIILRLGKLKEYQKVLKMLQKFSLGEVEQDPFKKGALLHYLQLSAEVCIDISQMVVIAENLAVPDSSADLFILLAKEKILSPAFGKRFAAVARFRNLLVHEYVKIDMKKVYAYLQKELGQFDTFAKSIARYVKRR